MVGQLFCVYKTFLGDMHVVCGVNEVYISGILCSIGA
jgi:hypothetical protein